ncbi:MAG: DUF4173 domain-containing protein [Actinomycetota bacterium]|nr:DUF4173 domain-containing protein [Actinomycetota bacterium]
MDQAALLDPPPGRPPGPRRRPDGATVRLAVLALCAGAAVEVGLRGGAANAAVVVGILLSLVALVTDGRLARRGARWLTAGAVVPAAFLAVRASPWLAASNAVAVAALVAAAVLHSPAGSLLDTTPRRLLRRVPPAARRALAAPVLLAPLVPVVPGRTVDAAVRAGRGALVALVPLAAVVALLASGDAVFARLLVPDVDVVPLAGHVALAVAFALGVVALVAAGAGGAVEDAGVESGRFGAVEVTTMLALAAGVLGLFVVSQLVALTDAGRRLVEDAGMTPAAYARSGFFQLCWATAVLVAFLGLVRALAAPEALARGAVRLLAGGVPLLALGLVAVSLRRMALYDRAFGLTMLRLWVVGAVVWLGVVLVMIAVRNLGVGAGRAWVAGGAGAAALVLVVLADLADPEAFVVRHNVARASSGAQLDVSYLGRLSDDAVPALAGALADARPGPEVDALAAALRCGEERTGARALNLAARRAAAARREVCRGP